MNRLDLPNINNINKQEIENVWETFNNHIMEGAKKYIPRKHFKIIPAFKYSNRTRILANIYNDRHNEYKNNMDIDKANILRRIKTHIDSSKAHDMLTFWSNKIDQLEEFKTANDLKNLYKTTKNLMGTDNYNKGTYIITPNKTGIHITRLYNATLSTGYFPKALKKANIIMLRKPNKPPTDPASSRPISQLDVQIKILEKIHISHRLKIHLENTQQLNPHQYRFRPGRSTKDVIITSFLFGHPSQTRKKDRFNFIRYSKGIR